MTEVWVCGQSIGPHGTGAWSFAGVFYSKEDAINACRDENYFIGPAVIGDELPHEPFNWKGAYYPKAEDGPREGYR